MRTSLGSLLRVSTWAALACTAPASFTASASTATQSTYYLQGYYKLRETNATWELSDKSPWQIVKNEPWIDPRLTKWGYVPVIHDGDHYYCLIDNKPMTGSNILEKTFICGDPKTAEFIFNNNFRPKLPLYGTR